ncbi:MFS transporter [Paraburkholderia xenovorans]|uniref:MFS transporter n=1 Tax=Paraburkholderia xenovorans TaxID=36873 RepID=UPI0002FA25C8|nr:MFS transporter [Paraburkholderia xenovorans]
MSNAIAVSQPDERELRKKVARAGAIGNFIEFYDFTLYGFFAVTIAELFFPRFDSVAGLLSTFALFGVGFFIRPLGAIAFGHIGDRWGRKRALLIAVGLMSASTAAIGVLPTYTTVGVLAPALLLICRLVQGFSAGGEQTGAFVLVVEHSPERERGEERGKSHSLRHRGRRRGGYVWPGDEHDDDSRRDACVGLAGAFSHRSPSWSDRTLPAA